MSATGEEPGTSGTLIAERLGGGERNLRRRTARGVIVNGVFNVGTTALNLIKGVAVAGFLTTAEYGRWGLMLAAFMALVTLASVGVDDKYIQQDDADQQRAFEVAFTFQAALSALLALLVVVGMPLFGLLYRQPGIVIPGMALALALPAVTLQMPLWTHYRRMDYMRQRSLQVIDPVVSFVGVLALAAAGVGIWGLVIGELTGTWVAAIVIVRASPYPLRFRWDWAVAREYRRFTWPLFVSACATVLLSQVPLTVGARVLGVAAVAALGLAHNISLFAQRVDTVVTQTLYPVICAVKDRADLLFESFWKSNRLALLWAAPLGASAALFAGDFVHYVLGDKWRYAVTLLAFYGVCAALNQIAFNWSAFMRALGDTRPLAVADGLTLIGTLIVPVPLLATVGLNGFGVGMVVVTVLGLIVRLWFLRRIFPALAVVGHITRGLGPAVAATGAVLALRAVAPSSPHGGGLVLIEVAIFVAIAAGVTYLSERTLLRESLGYLRGRVSFAGAAA